MNPNMVEKIAEHVGKVEEIDVGAGGNFLGQYARARVLRHVEKPLQRCVSVTAGPTGEWHIILIRYERLPEYCAAYDRVGHEVRHCDDVSVDRNRRMFGTWLKATRTMDMRRARSKVGHRGGFSGKEEGSRSDSVRNRRLMVIEGKESEEGGKDESSDSSNKEKNESTRGLGFDEGREYEEMEAEQGSLSARGRGDDKGGVMGELRMEGTGSEGTARGSNMLQNTPFRAKNILLATSPKKKSKGSWKKRARSLGKDKNLGGHGGGEAGETEGCA